MRDFLEKSAVIEKKAALIYRAFSKIDACDQDLKKLWERMARDEEDHASSLKLALSLPHGEAFLGAREDCPNPDEMMVHLDKILQRANQGEGSVYSMLKDAVTLENEFRKFHVAHALLFKNTSLLKTFEALSRADEVHVNDLNEYLEKYKAQNRTK